MVFMKIVDIFCYICCWGYVLYIFILKCISIFEIYASFMKYILLF